MVKRKSEIISRFLNPAIKYWLKTQLETVEDLEIKITAGDSKILRGKIDEVFLTTSKAVYQGIHVNQATVKTEKIAVNLGGVLKGKPLNLLQPIFVDGEIKLNKNDLQTSLNSALLQQGLVDLMELLLKEKSIDNYDNIVSQYQFDWQKLTIYPEKFMLDAILTNQQQRTFSFKLTSCLTSKDSHTLSLCPIQMEGIPEMPLIVLNDFAVDLGTDVEIKTLQLSATELLCQGKAKVVS